MRVVVDPAARHAVLAVISALLIGCGKGPTETYLLPEGLRQGWVVVEFGQATCSTSLGGVTGREIRVGTDGYGCTSESPDNRLMYYQYLLVKPDGSRKRVREGEAIHLPATVQVRMGACNLTAFSFWWGKKADIAGTAGDLLRARHPDCNSSP